MKAIYTVNDIKRILQPVFKKHNIKKAVLFGSYAKGEADAKSDIDIMVDSNLRGLAFYGLLEDACVLWIAGRCCKCSRFAGGFAGQAANYTGVKNSG